MKKMIEYAVGVVFISLTISIGVWHSHQRAYERGYRDGWRYNQQAIYDRGFDAGREQGFSEGKQSVFDDFDGIVTTEKMREVSENEETGRNLD